MHRAAVARPGDCVYRPRVPLYRVSYCDYERGKQVATDGGVEMSLAEILALMDEILAGAGSFINVADSEGALFQVFVHDDGSLMLDLPSPRERGSYSKTTDLAECKRVLEAMGGRIVRDGVDGLMYERW
jgi:hypothetical protein